MATKTHIVWRKATEQEIRDGSPEMIIESTNEVNVADPEINKEDASKMDIDSLTDEQITQLKARLAQ